MILTLQRQSQRWQTCKLKTKVTQTHMKDNLMILLTAEAPQSKTWLLLFLKSNWDQWTPWTSPRWISNKKSSSLTSIPPPTFRSSRNTKKHISSWLKIRPSTLWSHSSFSPFRWFSVSQFWIAWIGLRFSNMKVFMRWTCANSSQLWSYTLVLSKMSEVVFRCASLLFSILKIWQTQWPAFSSEFV